MRRWGGDRSDNGHCPITFSIAPWTRSKHLSDNDVNAGGQKEGSKMRSLIGCYMVVHVPGPLGAAISAATGHWANHCAIVVSATEVIEMWVPNAHIRPLSDYDDMRVAFNDREKLTLRQRKQIVAFAHSSLGWHYDYLHFLALGLHHLLGLDTLVRFPHLPATSICSRLVTLAGAAAGLDWTDGVHQNYVTPATLARRIEHENSEPRYIQRRSEGLGKVA